MLTPFCQQFDFGFVIVIQVLDQDGANVNMAQATNIKFRFQKPGGDVSEVDGAILDTGIEGKIYYVVEEDLIDEHGLYTFQAFFELPSGSTVSSERGYLRVYPSLELTV